MIGASLQWNAYQRQTKHRHSRGRAAACNSLKASMVVEKYLLKIMTEIRKRIY